VIIQRYNLINGLIQNVETLVIYANSNPKQEFVLFSDHEADCERRVAEAVDKFAEKNKKAPVQGYSAGIPWAMHLRAYDAYCKKCGPQKALIEGWCRGGFSTNELDIFIPGWREELSQLTAQAAEIADLKKQILADEQLNELLERWDETEPAMQRKIAGAFAAKLALAQAEIEEKDKYLRGARENKNHWLKKYSQSVAEAWRLRVALEQAIPWIGENKTGPAWATPHGQENNAAMCKRALDAAVAALDPTPTTKEPT
jgi:DNA-binding transcriptional MerR regulator